MRISGGSVAQSETTVARQPQSVAVIGQSVARKQSVADIRESVAQSETTVARQPPSVAVTSQSIAEKSQSVARILLLTA
ncbi:hypothetical protein D0S48_18705 [Psychrobacillus sp. AK 1817]|nr:hypothetical protein D0S48_18705 [Psychrobacillus sp. AK 1817]